MPVSYATSRRLLARLTLAALPFLAAASRADAQWFPPMDAPSTHELAQWFPPIGAASTHEIAERLRAEGFVLIGPLRRNDTVYLADVNAGPAGRERLVIDAWSGEILQRFVERSGSSRPGAADGYAIERGEFDSPPPLAPPPAREFFNGPGGDANLAYGGPANARIPDAVGPISPLERTPRTKVKLKPAANKPSPVQPKPATAALPPTPPAKPDEGGAAPAAKDTSGGAGAPASAAPAAASAAPAAASAAPAAATPPAPEASQQPSAPPRPDASPAGSSPSGAPDQTKAATPNPAGAATSPSIPQTQAKEEPRPAQSPAAVPSAPATTKPGDKSKVNDVPVNPLE
jgi:hypothetical protein